MDFLGLSAHQRKQHVEVVDHHVEHHADVDRAEGHRAHAIDLDEARPDRSGGDKVAHGNHDRVVSHDVTDLKQRTRLARHVGDRPGLRDIGSERLLDEARDARLQERLDDRTMRDGRRRDGHRVDTRCDQFLDRPERTSTPLLDDLARAIGVAVDHSDEIAPFGRRVEPRMVTAHLANADGRTAKRLAGGRRSLRVCCHRGAPAPSRRAIACATAFLNICRPGVSPERCASVSRVQRGCCVQRR